MDTSRETKTIKTAKGYEVTIKAWISGGENNQLQAVWLEDTKMSLNADGKTSIEGFNGMLEQKATKKLLEIMIISFKAPSQAEPVTSDVVKLVEDMPLNDYQEVVEALNEVTGKKKSPEKTTA
jgi:hypothetical protein